MTSNHETIQITNQENADATLHAKAAVIKNPPIRPGALGDLGNKIHDLQNVNGTAKDNVLGPPLAVAKKKVEITKKVSSIPNKENNINSKAKENKQAVTKKISDTTKTKAVEQSKQSLIYDPDEDTKNNHLMVTEYIPDILAYIRSIEYEFPVKEGFLEGTKVTSKMRTILVNWLVDAHKHFTMEPESLHLCVSVVDRYLQVKKSVDQSVLQLVGITALMLAAKYEEIYIPNMDDFVYVCADAFTKEQILQMEINIVRNLDFRLGWPISIYFLRRYSRIASVKASQHHLAKYILELALLEYNLAHVKPSIQAAAACCLAVSIINEIIDPKKVWTPTMMHYTKYKYSDFSDVVHEFAVMLGKVKTSKFDAVRTKYAEAKFGKISLNFKLEGPVVKKLQLLSIPKMK